MGNIFLSLDDDHETLLRQLAAEKYGSKKGSLSDIVMAAIDELAKENQKLLAKTRIIERMEKGYKLGFKGKVYDSRDELYD
jgi:hypothetical protein